MRRERAMTSPYCCTATRRAGSPGATSPPLLAGLGWRAVAPDLRGYGESSRPPRTADYAIGHLVEDVAGLFEAAGARRRLLIGHDWGAAIAWAFALERRLPLDGLVIMNVPHPAVLARVMRASWRQ